MISHFPNTFCASRVTVKKLSRSVCHSETCGCMFRQSLQQYTRRAECFRRSRTDVCAVSPVIQHINFCKSLITQPLLILLLERFDESRDTRSFRCPCLGYQYVIECIYVTVFNTSLLLSFLITLRFLKQNFEWKWEVKVCHLKEALTYLGSSDGQLYLS